MQTPGVGQTALLRSDLRSRGSSRRLETMLCPKVPGLMSNGFRGRIDAANRSARIAYRLSTSSGTSCVAVLSVSLPLFDSLYGPSVSAERLVPLRSWAFDSCLARRALLSLHENTWHLVQPRWCVGLIVQRQVLGLYIHLVFASTRLHVS